MTYRLLNEGEKILPTDEYYQPECVPKWVSVDSYMDGVEVSHILVPIRRAIEQPQIVESNNILTKREV